jgi:hypothetical protein
VSTRIDELETAVALDRSKALDWSDKAVLPAWYGRSIAEVSAIRPKLDELSTPMMTLDRGAIDENLASMSEWCAQSGLSLAPHGKTTMAPALWLDQLRTGSWAITVAPCDPREPVSAPGRPRMARR